MRYDWDVDSAIWQAKNGTPETQRTESAWVFVEAMAAGVPYSDALEMANDPEMIPELTEEEKEEDA